MHEPHGYNTRPYAQLPPSNLGMDARMTSQLNVALIRKLRGLCVCLPYLLNVIHGCLYNQTLADVKSTGGEIKCTHCRCDEKNENSKI